MPRKKDNPAVKKRGHNKFEPIADKVDEVQEESPPGKGDSATVADEASGPDTDQPIEGQVRNDATLRGEDHADEKLP